MNQVPASILFVCTGNTCRSPMAAAICTNLIARYYPGFKDIIKIASAGCGAAGGSPATTEAIKVIADRNLSIDDHRSKQVEASLLEQADLIVAMGKGHWRYLTKSWPAIGERVYTLREMADEEGDVADPIGRGENVYRQTAEELERLLKIMLRRLLGDPQQ